MIKIYRYKIQWWFNTPSNAYKVIRSIGVKSLDEINLRDDMNGNIVDSYTGFNMHSSEVADDVAIRYLKNKLKNNYYAIELLRR